MNLEELFGVDEADEDDRAIAALVEADERLLDDLRDLRRRNGLSQQDVADRLGVTQGAIARIESGARDPRLSTLRRYAFAVGAEVSHVVRARSAQRATFGVFAQHPSIGGRSYSNEWRHAMKPSSAAVRGS